jgi:hypothetical protein
VLHTSTRWWKPIRRPYTREEIAYTLAGGSDADAALRVMLPVREVAFDTLDPVLEFNVHALGRADPRWFMKDTDFQITYSFSTAVRSNTRGAAGGAYGSANMTLRRLYDLLCEEYNRGERFIDTYFQKKFPTSPAGRDFADFEAEARDGMRREWFDRVAQALEIRRRKAGGLYEKDKRLLLKDFGVWKSQYVRQMLRAFDRNIRSEIIVMLSTGRIPLLLQSNPKTMAVREARGIPPVPPFYATGQLIRGLQIDIRVPEGAFE